MKRFFKWTIGIAAVGIGAIATFRVIQAGREKLKASIGHAEAIANRTRAALAETEAALHDARTSL